MTFFKSHFPIILMAIFISACTTDELTYPSTYAYSHGNRTDQGVYTISNNKTNITRINGNLGSFKASKDALRDSLDAILALGFEINQIKKIELISETTIKVTSESGGVQQISEAVYTLVGNEIFVGGQSSNLTLSDDKSEIYFCMQMSVQSGLLGNGDRFIFSSQDICTTQDPILAVKNIINSNSSVYDSISIDFVNLVFLKK